MLEVLKIKNIAIIDSVEIHFKKGFNIITGETGAGKSIIIEAISLLLGSRASQQLIRAECSEAIIEGLFCTADIPWISSRLENHGLGQKSSELLIKRVIHREGRHRIYINGELATLPILQNICEGLIDLCGQHEHQSLLKSNIQLELLDQFGNLTHQAHQVAELLSQVRSLDKKRNALIQANLERKNREDFLLFQIHEIEASELVIGEEEKLQHEKQIYQSARSRAQIADATRQILESDESGVLNSLKIAHQKLRLLTTQDSRAQKIEEALERATFEIEEVNIELNRYLNQIDFNETHLQSIQDRLSQIADLRRKYGQDIPQILDKLRTFKEEITSLEQLNDQVDKISNQLRELEPALIDLASTLSKSRKKIQAQLCRAVTAELKDLKMEGSEFKIEFLQKQDISTWVTSADSIQFLIQTNQGEPFRPIGKVASGGELSRIMLAIRRIIADRGGIGVYLFDEIDAGIGGQTAFEVGKKLKSVASHNQVICITHLPQVASFADHHLTVQKSVFDNRTLTCIMPLNLKERKIEIARMLGGEKLTRKSIENAAELISLANP